MHCCLLSILSGLKGIFPWDSSKPSAPVKGTHEMCRGVKPCKGFRWMFEIFSVGIFVIKEKILWSQGATQKIHKNFTFELSDNKPNCFEVFSEIHKSLNKFALNRFVTLHKNSTVFSPYCTTNIHSPLCTYCTMDWYSAILRSITLHLVTFNPKIGSNHP